jgi:hypothetical protein
LTVPLDLFFQQIVAYESVPVAQTAVPATLKRAITYSPANQVFWSDGGLGLLDDPLFFDLLNTYFTTATPIPLEYVPDCPTGNCTWPVYDTLGVCSACTDASNLLTFGCKESPGDWLPFQDPSTDMPPNISTCGHYLNLPDNVVGPTLMSGYYINETKEIDVVLSTRSFNFMNILNQTFQIPNGTVNYLDIQNPIVDFVISVTPDGTAGALRNATPTINECQLHWCVKTVQSVYLNGNLTETVLKEQQLKTNDWWNPAPDPATYLPNFNLTLPDSSSPTGNTEFYIFNQSAQSSLQALQDFIPAIWSENMTVDPMYSPYLDGITEKYSLRNLNFLVGSEGNMFTNGKSASDLMAAVANTMSNGVRNTPTDPSNPNEFALVTGTAYAPVTLVKLRWAYATLPAALLLFSLIFLINVIFASARRLNEIGIWKTSALAVLFNGLGEQEASEIGPRIKMGNARQRAKQMEVMLEEQ